MPQHVHTPQYGKPLAVLTSLFFMWGLITSLNDILVPHLKGVFALSYVQAALVQFSFFTAYFVVSLPAGRLVQACGYQRGIVAGLCTAGIGCLLFYPAAASLSYPAFLGALFVLAAGITVLQVAANPYVTRLGPAKTASSRLNLTQAFNALGTTVAPLLGAMLILVDSHDGAVAEASAVQLPYLVLAGLLFAIAVVFALLRLPAIKDEHPQQAATAGEVVRHSVWQYRHLLLGAVAIFVYVGAEVSIGSFLVSLMEQPDIGGLNQAAAGRLLAVYWGCAMVGRFLGSVVMRHVAASKVLACNALLSVLLIAVAVLCGGKLAMWSLLAVGLCNSIMFPTIFSLALNGLGRFTSAGSGVLCMAIVGGALMPLLQASLADSLGLLLSFVVPLLCYLFIFYYGIAGHKPR
ncbi:sugar MFS transporter [Vogesella indigofera]|uniref:FHS family L-fucose permease-like MFS transporter n=1 Tax=Vogesella indigofera TaxID=45465 RepID=A0A495BJ08_VOGIN|nr:sugar MFS transporter [Vogesella indigofera]MDC7690288.1 sugar MFS transporter [Vogesella indigofera]RKQ61329.1 FHS family L-fucose permease-like MFS transporter [Vogesella indigofera]